MCCDGRLRHCISDPASLTVNEAINITSNPASQQICEGNNVNFMVNASGTSLVYQWRKNGVNLSDNARVSGSKTKTLSIANAAITERGVYSCRIIASCGSKSSLPATLEVYPQTAIIIQPIVFAAVENGNASFSVTADGNSLSYQWYRDALALSDGGVYSGANLPILTLTGLTRPMPDRVIVKFLGPAEP